MKRLFILVFISLGISLSAQDRMISFGFENAFAFRSSKYKEINALGIDITQYTIIKENNSIIVPGGFILGRFLKEKGSGGFFKIKYLSAINVKSTQKTSTATGSTSQKDTNTSSDYDYTYMIDVGAGVSGQYFKYKPVHFVVDFGVFLQLDKFAFKNDAGAVVFVGGGILTDLAVQYDIKHMRFELGLNAELGIGPGGRSEPGLSIKSFDIIGSISPYLSMGFKW